MLLCSLVITVVCMVQVCKDAIPIASNIILCHNNFIHCWFVSKVNLFMFYKKTQ